MNEQAPSLVEFAKHSPIPKKVLLLLNREGLIQDPLAQVDQIGLHLLEKLWGRKDVLRPQLNRMSMKARVSFLRTATLNSKWERYAYSRFYNQETGSGLSLATVIEEIQTTFRFRLSKQQFNRVKTLRHQAWMAMDRAQNNEETHQLEEKKAQTNK